MIQEKYNPHEIEAKWQAYWEEHKTFKTEMDSSRPKSMCWKCSRILPAICTWAMSVTILSATL